MLGARRAGGGHPVQIRPPDADRVGPQAQRLHHIAAPPDAALDQDLGPPADSPGDSGQRVQGAHGEVQLPPAVVRHHHAVRAEPDRTFGVIGVQDALDEERTVPVLAHPREVVPVQFRAHHPVLRPQRGDRGPGAPRLDQVSGGDALVLQEVHAPSGACRGVQDPGRRDHRRVSHAALALGFPVAEHGDVDRDEHAGVAGVLRPLHQRVGELVPPSVLVGPGIQLEEMVALRAGRHFLEGVRARRAHDGQRAGLLRRLRRADLAGPVRQPDQAGRSEQDRERDLLAADGDGQVRGLVPREDLRLQHVPAERSPIGPQCLQVLGPVVDVGPDHVRHRTPGPHTVVLDGYRARARGQLVREGGHRDSQLAGGRGVI